MRPSFVFLTIFFAWQLRAADSQLPIPHLHGIFPCGAKQGTTVELEFVGDNFDAPKTLYFSHAGFGAELIPEIKAAPAAKDKPEVKAAPAKFKVTVKPDVPVGEYDVRFVGKLGISNPRTFVVGDIAEINETEPNNEKAQANRVELNTTINGRINASEDVDWYVFKAKQGQRVLIECEAWRIDSKMDGVMWLYNSDGKLMASSQDEDLTSEKRDPFIDFDAPIDGDYYVKITDFTYNGGNGYFYRLKISTLPFVDFIMPTAAAPGTTAAITFYGRNLPGSEKTDLTIKGRPLQKLTQQIAIPNDPDAANGLNFSALVRPWMTVLNGMEVRVKSPEGVSNPKLLSFSTLPQVLKAERNASKDEPQRIEVPCAISGQFMKGDFDRYVLKQKKGEKYQITVYSARLGSPADPDLEILNTKGESIATTQDINENIGQLRFPTQNLDLVYTHNAGNDEDVILKLEHLYRQNQGGPQYTYRMEIEKNPTPDFQLICSPIHEIHIDSHEVYQGGRERFDILVFRTSGHNEPITVEAKNLPPGVTAEPIVIGKEVKWGTLIVTAAPDAPIGEGEFEVIGKSKIKTKDKDGKDTEIELVRKARGGTIVWDTVNTNALARMTHSLVMAVREKVPFMLTAEPKEITVKQGDPINLSIALKRREDMPAPVQLTGAGYQLPPGMEIPLTTIEKDKNDAKLTIKTDKMKEGVWSFTVSGDAQVPVDKKNIRCVYPSNSIKITIEPKEVKAAEKK
ncbi:MAG TPA: PPC domain-containing protein [Planctomycetota bacterium]|nr:PPC domain-containing protein [Planctomycetota bacterium]